MEMSIYIKYNVGTSTIYHNYIYIQVNKTIMIKKKSREIKKN